MCVLVRMAMLSMPEGLAERAGEAPAQRIDSVEHSATIIHVMAGVCRAE